MTGSTRPFLALALLALPAVASAGDWSGEVGAGYLSTEGNSKTRSSNAKASVVYKDAPWTNTFIASAVNASSTAGTTAERYAASDKVDYLFTDRSYAFVVVEYEKDLFGAVRERTSEAVGLGRHFLEGPAHFLDGELGVGVRQSELNPTVDEPDGERRSETIGRAGVRYEWKFNDKNSFLQSLKSEGGEDNVFSESVTQLKLQVIGQLAAALAHTIRYNSEVPAGTEHADSETSVNLVYAFGTK